MSSPEKSLKIITRALFGLQHFLCQVYLFHKKRKNYLKSIGYEHDREISPYFAISLTFFVITHPPPDYVITRGFDLKRWSPDTISIDGLKSSPREAMFEDAGLSVRLPLF
jgi:hypothetical protein